MLTKVISGAQSGADIGGLVAAKLCGLETGGWMPKGFKTQNGPRPEYAKIFGIQEHTSPNYKSRTYENVYQSDGTIRIASNFQSPGEICTLNAIKFHKKPYLDISIQECEINKTVNWLQLNQLRTLNVAGNSDRTSPNIGIIVCIYLIGVFQKLGYTFKFNSEIYNILEESRL